MHLINHRPCAKRPLFKLRADVRLDAILPAASLFPPFACFERIRTSVTPPLHARVYPATEWQSAYFHCVPKGLLSAQL